MALIQTIEGHCESCPLQLRTRGGSELKCAARYFTGTRIRLHLDYELGWRNICDADASWCNHGSGRRDENGLGRTSSRQYGDATFTECRDLYCNSPRYRPLAKLTIAGPNSVWTSAWNRRTTSWDREVQCSLVVREYRRGVLIAGWDVRDRRVCSKAQAHCAIYVYGGGIRQREAKRMLVRGAGNWNHAERRNLYGGNCTGEEQYDSPAGFGGVRLVGCDYRRRLLAGYAGGSRVKSAGGNGPYAVADGPGHRHVCGELLRLTRRQGRARRRNRNRNGRRQRNRRSRGLGWVRLAGYRHRHRLLAGDAGGCHVESAGRNGSRAGAD